MGGLNPAHVPYWRVNNPTLWDFCVSMIGRADIEGSKRPVKSVLFFCFAPWKHDKTQNKNWSASTRAMEDSSLYIFERHLDWSPKPNASSRRWLVPCSRRGWLANLDKGCGRLGRPGNSYRAAIGFCRKRLLRGPRYTERASRLLFCGEGWLRGREQGTGKNSYRGVVGFFVLVTFSWASFFPWQGNFLTVGAESRQKKILPWRSRILGLEAFQETWLHRTHFPASFLWWGMACRAWAGRRQKLPTAA